MDVQNAAAGGADTGGATLGAPGGTGTSALTIGQAPGLVQAAPDYKNLQKLLQEFGEAKRRALDSRWIFERAWWRNLLYVLGRQWIFYDKRRGQWLDKRMAKWMPRPVTNLCAQGVEAISAVFASISLSTLARPIGGRVQNVAAAEVADSIQPFIHAEHLMDQTLREMDFWLIVTGNAFLHPMWDKNAQHGQILIPYEMCTSCQQFFPPNKLLGMNPTCPACGRNQFAQNVRGPDGNIVGETHFVGKGRTDALSPFEIAVPPVYRDFEMAPEIIQMTWHPETYYEEDYPDYAKKIQFTKSPTDRSMQLLRSLATQNDMSAAPLAFGWGGGQDTEQTGATKYRWWKKPCRAYPDGLFVEVVGEGEGALILEEEGITPGPLPNRTKDGRPIMPFIHAAYQPVGGRLWARSPLDIAIPKQDDVNRLDCQVQLTFQRTANPIWLEPKGAEVKSFTGEPGLVVKYNPLIATGAKPERIPGENIQPSMFQLRQQYLDDFEQLMGTYDVLKGTKPAGVEAFSALQLLVERGQARLATVFAERGEAYRKWFAIALELERENGPTERVESVLSPNGGWTYHHFENAQLDGAIDIVVEDGSQAPKTNLGKRAAMEHANQMGFIDPSNPETRYKVLSDLGLTNLIETLDSDVKDAKREQDAFEQWVSSGGAQQAAPQLMLAAQQWQMATQQYQQVAQQAQQIAATIGVPPTLPPPPSLPELTPFMLAEEQDNAVHYGENRKWALTDTARSIFQQFPFLKPYFDQHLAAHKAKMQEEQMQRAQVAAGPPKQGGAMARSNGESGNPRDVPHGNRESNQRRGPE
jgi:hypothetical protein